MFATIFKLTLNNNYCTIYYCDEISKYFDHILKINITICFDEIWKDVLIFYVHKYILYSGIKFE